MDLEEIREHLGSMEVWVNKAKAWWLETPNLDVEKMARLMVDIGALGFATDTEASEWFIRNVGVAGVAAARVRV